jgi:hypothetical protein
MITYRAPISEDIDINHVNHFYNGLYLECWCRINGY